MLKTSLPRTSVAEEGAITKGGLMALARRARVICGGKSWLLGKIDHDRAQCRTRQVGVVSSSLEMEQIPTALGLWIGMRRNFRRSRISSKLKRRRGARVLQDQLYLVKADNVNRTTVIDYEGKVFPGAAEALGQDNDLQIAKMAWLSRKDSTKVYGSMVGCDIKAGDVRRLLNEGFLYAGGYRSIRASDTAGTVVQLPADRAQSFPV